MVEKFGDKKTGIVRMSMLGRNIVIVSHKDHIKELLLTKEKFFKKYPPSYEAFKIFGDNILSMLEADTWKPHHRICSPAFSSNNLKFVTKVTCESFDEMVAHRWEKLPDANGSFILPIDDYSDLTLQVLGRSIFGLDFGLFSDDPTKNESNFRKSLEILLTKGILFKRFLSETPILKYLYPYVMSYFGVDKALELVSTKLDKIIQEKKEIYENDKLEGTEHNDLLTMMIETNSSLTESQLDNTKSEHGGLTKDEIKSNSFIFSLAGNDTSSSLSQWASYVLAKRPDIQQKLYDNIQNVLGDREPTFDDYEKLTYVNAFIMETLRVHGPVGGIIKVAKKDVELGEFKIPKNTSILLSLAQACNSDKNWENPTEFNPDRFPDAETQLRYQHSFSWMPFSMANRKCIGYKFALIELNAIFTKLVRKYKLELLNDESVDPIGKAVAVTIRPTNLKIKATLRNKTN
ncbi:predicted protein [Naegleria gruberi]|uniref:Predicted protein n=1 Tax=Naegleria gruberi TaxID=5762 RepID=D2VXI7_NAEGR|nr:uncharacterized protein NAEGRDRAFT_53036 [Naegleria gruberi]EFC38517.1 predicted protein [Naegleria gruberi]|eukprot:XP_002671261.1 predicted protein [Naegleria gruberi strain NEG-M]